MVHSVQDIHEGYYNALEFTKNKEGHHISLKPMLTSDDTLGDFCDVWFELASHPVKFKSSATLVKTLYNAT